MPTSKSERAAQKRHEANVASNAEYPLRVRIRELEASLATAIADLATATAGRNQALDKAHAYRDAFTAMVRLQAFLDSGKL
jgi:hypothetical protein